MNESRSGETGWLDAILHGSGVRGAGNAGAGVAESVDAAASKAAVREGLGVRVPPPVPPRLPRWTRARQSGPVANSRARAPLDGSAPSVFQRLRATEATPSRPEEPARRRMRPPRPACVTARKPGPICSSPDFPSDPGQSVKVTLSMSRARPSQAAARRTRSLSSGVGEARSSARLAVKYSGRKPAPSSAFM